MEDIWAECFQKLKDFQKQDISQILSENGHTFSDITIRKKLKKAVDCGELIKLGRNHYRIPQADKLQYCPAYSEYAIRIAKTIQTLFPFLDFSIFELVLLNEFVNHQIAHNTVFVAVESEAADFVFDALKDIFPGKVLINPTKELYHQYCSDDMMIITKLVSQRPTQKQYKWQVRLEVLLVDLFADSILRSVVSQSEYPTILNNAFEKYIIDENSMFRYAKRRTADNRIYQMIKEKTDITLRTRE